MSAQRQETMATSRSQKRSAWRRWLIEIERGMSQSFRGESALFGHCFLAAIILITGLVLKIGVAHWAIVLLSLSVAASAEMFQMVLRSIWTDLEAQLSKDTRKSLQIGCAAVVVTRLGAVSAVLVIYANAVVEIW